MINTHYSNDMQFIEIEGKASIGLKDGKYPGYSMVPVIYELKGDTENLLTLINYVTAKLKGPLLSNVVSPLLMEYGFNYSESGIVWDPFQLVEVR